MSRVEERVIDNDYTISYQGKRYQIGAKQAKARMRRRKAAIEQRLNGEIWLRWDDKRIRLEECREAEPTPEKELPETTRQALARKPVQPRGKPNKSWMKDFSVKRRRVGQGPAAATPVALRAPCVPAAGP